MRPRRRECGLGVLLCVGSRLVFLRRLGGDLGVRLVCMRLRRSLRLGGVGLRGGCFRFFQNCLLLLLDRARRRRGYSCFSIH